MTDDAPRMTLLLVAKLVLLASMHRGIKLFIFVPNLTGAADDSGDTEPIVLAAVKFDVFRIVILKPLNRRGKVSTFAALPSTTNRRDI